LNTTSQDSKILPLAQCRHMYALQFSAKPRWVHSNDFTSSFWHFSSGTWMWASHPKILRCESEGLFPVYASNRVSCCSRALVGRWFCRWATCSIASPQYLLGRPAVKLVSKVLGETWEVSCWKVGLSSTQGDWSCLVGSQRVRWKLWKHALIVQRRVKIMSTECLEREN
jgi:hypothetical protein